MRGSRKGAGGPENLTINFMWPKLNNYQMPIHVFLAQYRPNLVNLIILNHYFSNADSEECLVLRGCRGLRQTFYG